MSDRFEMPPPGRWERLLALVAPQRAMAAYKARVAFAWAQEHRSVPGAGSDRLYGEWTAAIKDADAATRYDRQQVINRVRTLVLGSPYAAGAVGGSVANIVSTGIRPQSALKPDTPETTPLIKPPGWVPIDERAAERFQKQAEAFFAEFAEAADLGERLDFYEMQGVVETARTNDGELLVHFARRKQRGAPTSFGLELIEADRLGTPIRKITDGAVRDGVVIDPETGAPVAYWIKDAHPGDTTATIKILDSYRRVDRTLPNGMPNCLHFYDVRRPGQTRGFSDFAPSLAIFESLDRYWEAENMRARIGACTGAFITSPAAKSWQAGAGETDSDGNRVQKLQPGRIMYLMPGESVSFADPSSPNAQFAAYTEALLRAVGVSLHMPWELVALDFSKTNYSSARSALLEARRWFRFRQSVLIKRFCMPVWKSVIREGIALGRIDAPGFRARAHDYLAARWTPPSWGWVDPVKEETAARESIANFLSTHQDELAAQGKDFDQVAEQLAREHKKLKQLELPSPFDAIAPPGGMDPAAAADAGKQAAKKEIEDALAG